MAKPALGKGLGALIRKQDGEEDAVAAAQQVQPGEVVRKVPLSEVVPSPLQPRGHFREEALQELVESIRQHGVMQPLIVRRVGQKLELIAGERRWRASGQAELKTVPIIEREASDQEVLEMALVENLQRQDLNPLEEAAGYARLAREFHMKQGDIAQRVGKSRASVANTMRLLELAPDLQDHVSAGRLTVGHAKALLGLKDHGDQVAAARRVLEKKATVRATERYVRNFNRVSEEGAGKAGEGSAGSLSEETRAHFRALENQLREHFATHVQIVPGKKKGRIELEYYGADDLQRLLDLLGVEVE